MNCAMSSFKLGPEAVSRINGGQMFLFAVGSCCEH